MPANGRWDLIRRLKVKSYMGLHIAGSLPTYRTVKDGSDAQLNCC